MKCKLFLVIQEVDRGKVMTQERGNLVKNYFSERKFCVLAVEIFQFMHLKQMLKVEVADKMGV